MSDGAGDGDQHGGEQGRDAGEQAERDAGEGHVPEPVAEQREPTLHEERPDGRRGQPGERCGDQGTPHEVVVEQLDHRNTPSPPSTSGLWLGRLAWWWTCSCSSGDRRPRHRCTTRPSPRTTARSTSAHEAQLVRDDQHRGPLVRPGRRAARRASPVVLVDPGRRLIHDEQVGSPASARATSTRCCCPPDGSAAGERRSTSPRPATARSTATWSARGWVVESGRRGRPPLTTTLPVAGRRRRPECCSGT